MQYTLYKVIIMHELALNWSWVSFRRIKAGIIEASYL